MLITDAKASAVYQATEPAREALREAGYSVADDDTPLGMVKKLIGKIESQQRLEEGLRERLKVAAEFSGEVIETDTTYGAGCVFWAHGRCAARGPIRDPNIRCKHDPGTPHFPGEYPIPACRLEEGPILVKTATKDSDGKTEGAEG